MSTTRRSTPRRSPEPAARRRPAVGTFLAVLGAALLVGACSSTDFRVTPPDNQPATMTLFVQVPAEQVSNAVEAGPSFSVRIEEDGDVLNITEAQLAVDQIEFGRTTGVCVDSTASDDGDACNEALTSPDAFSVPVDQGEIQLTNRIGVEAGDYDRLEIDLHRATAQDVNLIGSFTPGNSVRVAGSFNSQGVSVQFSPEASLELMLGEEGESFPLEEGDTGAMTLVIDVASWFRDAEGNLVDPRVAAEDPDLKAQVEQNIVESFSATPGTPQ